LNPAANRPEDVIALCAKLLTERQPVINMAFHSSELLAGGSPTVLTNNQQDRVWSTLEHLFGYISQYAFAEKQTLTEYARQRQNANAV